MLFRSDKHNKLRSFRDNYGLEVLSLDINNIKLSEAVQKAKNETAVAKEGIRKAEHEKTAAKIRAEGEKMAYETIFDLADQKGLKSDQAVTLLSLYTYKEIAKNPNSHMLFNVGSSSNMDPRMLGMLYGGKGFFGDGNQQNNGENLDEESENVKKRKR